jgi:hypothetical protein
VVREIEFKLGAPALAQLATVAGNANKLAQIQEIISGAGIVSDIKSITKRISTEAGVSMQDADKIVRSLVNLYNMLVDMAASPSELIEALSAHLEQKTPETWRAGHLHNWKAAQIRIIETLASIKEDSPLATFAKSREVLFGHENIYDSARIFTAVRPVFNRNGDKVLQMLVLHDLVLEFYAGAVNETRKIQISLNASEVAELKNQCERAQRKAGAIKLAFTGQPWKTTIATNPVPDGDDNDDEN